LKALNELLTWEPKEGLRKRYNALIKRGKQQEFIDLSLLKKMDSHLEWALRKREAGTELKKEEIGENVDRIVARNKKIETEAEANARKMGERILQQLNKKVAGRAESIEKVKMYLDQQQKWEEEEEQRALAAAEEEEEPEMMRETLVFPKCHDMKPSTFTITPMQTPSMAAYQEKQLKYMGGDHIWNRKSDTTNRKSDLTADTNAPQLHFVDDEMPFATAPIINTVKAVKRKSLLLVADSIVSPKTGVKARNALILPEPSEDDYSAAGPTRTTASYRMRQLDRSIEDHVNNLKAVTRPASREREHCFTTLQKGVCDQYNERRRSLLGASDRAAFDRQAALQRHSALMKNTLEAHHLHNKFSDKMKTRLNDSPLRRMK